MGYFMRTGGETIEQSNWSWDWALDGPVFMDLTSDQKASISSTEVKALAVLLGSCRLHKVQYYLK